MDNKSENSRLSSLAQNTILLSIGTLLNKGLQFVMIPLYSRWLSTEDYGTFDLLCTYVLLLVPIITMACSEALFRFTVTEETEEQSKKYASSAFAICAVNSLIAICIISIYAWNTQWDYVLPFSLLVLGEVFQTYMQGYMRGQKKINIYSFFSAITTVFIAVSSTVFVLALDMGLAGLLYGYGIGYLLGDLCIAIAVNLRKHAALSNVSFQSSKELIKYSYPLIPNNISWWVISVSDRLIIQAFLGVAANGVYAIAAKVPNLCSAIFGMFNISWQQSASESVGDKDNVNYFNSVYNSTNRTITSLCIGLLSVNFVLFDFIFDAKYTSGRYYAPVLIVALIFSTLSSFMGGIQISLKRPKENGITTVIGAITNVLINIIFVRYWGLYAACISTVVANAVVCILRRIRLPKEYQLKLEKENYVLILFLLYFVGIQYITFGGYIFKAINFLLAVIIFLYASRSFVTGILKRIKK